MYKAVIFDCDGVLVDSEDITNQVLIDIAASVGISIDLEEVHRIWVGKSLTGVFQHMENMSGQSLPEDIEQKFRAWTFEAFRNGLQAVEGVKELIKALNVPFCVASNGPLHKMELTLEITGLLPYFNNQLYSAYQVQKWKPEPDLFLYAAQQLGFAPSECIIIEDSLMGVQAGLAGGFQQVYAFCKKAPHLPEKIVKTSAIPVFDMKELAQRLNLVI